MNDDKKTLSPLGMTARGLDEAINKLFAESIQLSAGKVNAPIKPPKPDYSNEYINQLSKEIDDKARIEIAIKLILECKENYNNNIIKIKQCYEAIHLEYYQSTRKIIDAAIDLIRELEQRTNKLDSKFKRLLILTIPMSIFTVLMLMLLIIELMNY